MNIATMCFIALAVLAVHYRNNARILLDIATPVLAAEQVTEEVWEVSDKPCAESKDGWVCITEDVSRPATAPTKTKQSSVVRFLGKKYTEKQITVAKQIVSIAKQEGFDQLSLLLAIADCESSLIPSTVNTKGNNPTTSRDEGVFQYNNHWQRKNLTSSCAFDVDCATKQAIKDLRAGKKGQWVCTGIIEGENRLPFYSQFLKQL